MAPIETSVTDPLALLARMAPRKRQRLKALILGPTELIPSSRFLDAIAGELGFDTSSPDFFGFDIELDAIFAAFNAAVTFSATAVPESNLFEDRRGRMEMDSLKIDALLAYRRPTGTEDYSVDSKAKSMFDLILIQGRDGGKWTGRRTKRIAERLRRVFGNDGTLLSGAKAHFVAIGGDRPGRSATAVWPLWMRREEGSPAWIPFVRSEGEVSIIRCDRHGRPRKTGEFWKLG
jgi:hypothetical protein